MPTATKPKTPKTEPEFRAMAGHAAALKLEAAELQAEHDSRAQELAQQYEDRIAALNAEARALTTLCKKFAEKTPDLFAKRRSLNLGTAVVGFRTTPHKVKTTRRGDTLAKVALRLRALPWAGRYVRTPDPTVNKDALIEDREELSAEQLTQAGVAIVQEERFFLDPVKRDLGE